VKSLLTLAIIVLSLTGCFAYPKPLAERALYLDLRKIVETNEDSGWIADEVRLHANLEPALRSICQVSPAVHLALDRWLEDQLHRAGGSAEAIYRAHGSQLSAASEALSIERVRALLSYAHQHANECPFWLTTRAGFAGEQSDAGRWVLLAESTGFASLMLKRWIPALGGGGRLLVGHGVGSQLTLAIGAELSASGAFVPTGNQGFDAFGSVAVPVLMRVTRFSRLLDLELAPVMRFGSGPAAWPPGARVELGLGISGLRGSAFMSYTMLYLGYELHWRIGNSPTDQTLQIGTRLAVDWAP
jgi:hypothetical protein